MRLHSLSARLAAGLAVPLLLAAGGPAGAAPAATDDGLLGRQDPTSTDTAVSYSVGAFPQSLALLGVAAGGRAAAPATDAAVAWLLGQQCPDGGWQYYRADVTAACTAPNAATYTGEDTNSTALAVEALAALGRTASRDPLTFLRAAQNADGGWGYVPGAATDPNSTALVIQAFLARRVDPATLRGSSGRTAYDALLGYQLGCSAPAADRGGFAAFDPSSPDALASGQAVPAAAGKAFPLTAATLSSSSPTPTCPAAAGSGTRSSVPPAAPRARSVPSAGSPSPAGSSGPASSPAGSPTAGPAGSPSPSTSSTPSTPGTSGTPTASPSRSASARASVRPSSSASSSASSNPATKPASGPSAGRDAARTASPGPSAAPSVAASASRSAGGSVSLVSWTRTSATAATAARSAGNAAARAATVDPTAAAGYGATWLAGQLGSRGYIAGPGGPGYGLTAYAVLSMAATGTNRAAAERGAAYLAGHVDPAVRDAHGLDKVGNVGLLALVAAAVPAGGADAATLADRILANCTGTCTAAGPTGSPSPTASPSASGSPTRTVPGGGPGSPGSTLPASTGAPAGGLPTTPDGVGTTEAPAPAAAQGGGGLPFTGAAIGLLLLVGGGLTLAGIGLRRLGRR